MSDGQKPKKALKAPITPSVLTNKVNLNNDPTTIPKNINPGGYNQFQSFLAKKNLVNDPRMNTNEGRKELTDAVISEFNSGDYVKQFPKNAITPEAIKAAQQYHKLSDPNVVVDGWVGSQASQLRYPTYSTTAEVKSTDPSNPNFNIPVKDTIDVQYGNKTYKLASDKFNKGAMRTEDFIDPQTKQFPFKQTVVPTTVQQRKNGGLVSKVKKYALGGDVDPNEFNQFNGQNPEVTGLASGALNAAIPGAGTAYGIGTGLLNKQTSKMSEIDPTTGKFVNKDKAKNAGLMNAAFNMSGLGMVQTAMDPNKSLKEKALSIGTYGISDMIGNKKNVDKMEAKNIGIVDEQKKQEQARLDAISQQENLARQMAQRTASYKDGGIIDETAELQRKTKNTPKVIVKVPVVKITTKAPLPPDKKGLEEQKKLLGFKDGGKIEGKGSGTSDSITATVKPNSFVVPAKNSAKAEVIRKVILPPSGKKTANLKQEGGAKVKLSNGEHLFTPKEVEKIETVLGDNALDKLAPNSAKREDVVEGMGLYPGGKTPYNTPKPTTKTAAKSVAKKGLAAKVAATTPDYLQAKEMGLPISQLEPSVNSNGSLDPSAQIGYAKAPSGKSYSLDLSAIGNVAEYAIPMLQAGYGLSQLKKLGKRPVGELDKDYLASINKAQGNVELANAQAKYGFTPEEQALINSENANATNAQRFEARNLSGGSAGNAYNMERSASNQQFGRGLKAAVENRNLMLQKQGIAADRQSYLDNLVANKANVSRTLFNDKMNAFQQNQQAGAGLLSAGLQNIIGAKRYQDELSALKETGNIRNSTYNTLGQ